MARAIPGMALGSTIPRINALLFAVPYLAVGMTLAKDVMAT
jgi:hypothetical protein